MALIIKLIAYSFLTFIACYFYVENFKLYTIKKKVVLGIVILFAFSFGVLDILYGANDSKKDKLESKDLFRETDKHIDKKIDTLGQSVGSSFNKLHGKLDTGFNSLHKKNTLTYSAILGLSPNTGNNNPFITKKGDSLTIHISFSNYGNQSAFNVRTNIFCVNKENGQLIRQNRKTKAGGNKSTLWYQGSTLSYPGTIDYIPNYHADSTFFCIKVDFSDALNRRKSYMDILLLNNRLLSFSPLDDDDYIKVEKFLKENSFWKPPFKQ